jgi:hypothetical protein
MSLTRGRDPYTGSGKFPVGVAGLQVADLPAEVHRLTGLGATVVEPAHDDDGLLSAVLADPQDNEFCVIRSPEVTTASKRSDAVPAHERRAA